MPPREATELLGVPATVEDLFSRRMLGHAPSEHHDAALVVASLQMAAATRGGDVNG
ncbi:hypothetical protein ACQP1W_00745 [Spirillospora sp. CA-255316]